VLFRSGLMVQPATKWPCEHAVVLKITE
jgi:hypothetical protein